MNQQEFERHRQENKDIFQPQYPYTWSSQEQREGMPRDEPPVNYGVYADQDSAQHYHTGQTQVPWWARPQPQQNGPLVFAAIIAIAILLALVMGALGIAGLVLGSLAHIAGVIIGAVFALLLFVFLLIFLILSLVRRAIGRVFEPRNIHKRRARQTGRRL